MIFSKRLIAGFDFCFRISRYTFPISGKSSRVFANHTLPINPVTPINITRLPANALRTESGASFLSVSQCTTGRTIVTVSRSAGIMACAIAFQLPAPRSFDHWFVDNLPSAPACLMIGIRSPGLGLILFAPATAFS